MAGASTGSNKAWEDAKPGSSDSVMRSYRGSPKAISVVLSGIAPWLKVNRYSVTRSMRCSGKPQLRAMSVALEAHGDTVPKRGLTTKLFCAGVSHVRVGPSKRCKPARESAPRTCSLATK